MLHLSYYFLVLDIETSTLFQDVEVEGKIVKEPRAVWLSYGWIKLYHIKTGEVDKLYFRNWVDLGIYLAKMCRKYYEYKMICYVHNLSYEFDFLIKNLSLPLTLLTNSSHRVISSTLIQYQNIEFRCTYQLTGYSLRKLGDMLHYPKLESDYRCIFPEDEPTKDEIDYCERDCDIVAKYITDVGLKEYGKLFDIPLTKTGRVRKKFAEFYKQCRNPDWDLLPPENCYQAMLDAFKGGVTISNPLFTNKKLVNVHSYDETSAYPYVMLKEEFPFSIRKSDDLSESNLTYYRFWIAKLKFKNIKSKYAWQWLSISKLNYFDLDTSVFFNGKLIKSDEIILTITNVDYESILLTYDFTSMEIIEFYPMERWGKLPFPYIETIKYYSQRKFELKNKLKSMDENDPEYTEVERDYMLSKNDFNSIYGMSVQKLMSPEFEIDENFIWKQKDIPYKYKPNKHIKRNFLIGVYVTAYARRNLLRGIVKNCPYTFVYCDTDSIKFIGENNFIDTNEPLDEEFLQIKSLSKLGQFDYEGDYEEFITFGAKKYAYKKGEKYSMTVAGLPKTVDEIHSLDEFYIGRVFEDCKLATKYLNNNTLIETDDDFNIISKEYDTDIEYFFSEHGITSNGGIGLYLTSYKLDITHEDLFIINEYRKGEKQWLKTVKRTSGIDLTNWYLKEKKNEL